MTMYSEACAREQCYKHLRAKGPLTTDKLLKCKAEFEAGIEAHSRRSQANSILAKAIKKYLRVDRRTDEERKRDDEFEAENYHGYEICQATGFLTTEHYTDGTALVSFLYEPTSYVLVGEHGARGWGFYPHENPKKLIKGFGGLESLLKYLKDNYEEM